MNKYLNPGLLVILSCLLLAFTSLSANASLAIPAAAVKKAEILSHFHVWRGVKYQWGGVTHQGIDCSAYMQRLYRDEFAIGLPRTTGEMIHRGRQVGKRNLQVGDLVFFKTGATTRHVGIYIGDGEFIHASSSRGVTQSDLDTAYWSSRYLAARRIFTNQQNPGYSS